MADSSDDFPKLSDMERARASGGVSIPENVDSDPVWAARRRLARLLHDIGRSNVARKLDLQALEAAEKALTPVADALRDFPDDTLAAEIFRHGSSRNPNLWADRSSVVGRTNPVAPPLKIREGADGGVEGEATFTELHQGPPGCVHGGHLAAAFDQLCGSAALLTGKKIMTGKLSVTYRKPTPLDQTLRFTARVVKEAGRGVFVEAQVFAGDNLTAEAEGVFIQLKDGFRLKFPHKQPPAH